MSDRIDHAPQPLLSAEPTDAELTAYFDAIAAQMRSAGYVPRSWQPAIQVAQRAFFAAAGFETLRPADEETVRAEPRAYWRDVRDAVVAGKAATGRAAFEVAQEAGGYSRALEWCDLGEEWQRGWNAVPASILRVDAAWKAYAPGRA